MAFGFTYTLPTITGSHTDFPVILRTADFPPEAIDGSATAILNGGGNLRAYTDNTKTTQLSVDVVRFVSSGSPEAQVWIKTSAQTSGVIFIEADPVVTTQPAVGAAFGRNSVWADYEFVSHNLTEDATGNYPNAFTITGTPTQSDGAFGTLGGYTFDGVSGDFIDADVGGRDPFGGLVTGDIITVQAYMSSSGTGGLRRGIHIRTAAAKGIQGIQEIDQEYFGVNVTNDGINSQLKINISGDSTVYNNVLATLRYQPGGASDPSDLIYLDGDSSGTGDSGFNLSGGAAGDFIRMGARSDGGSLYSGDISELKYRKSGISADWAATEEDNQSSIGAWGTVGSWTSIAFGFIYTLPTINGSHSNFPLILKTVDFPTEAISGSQFSIDNGGGNLRAYTDKTKTTRLPVEIVRFISSATPEAQVWVSVTAATGATIYIEADAVESTQPAVGAAFGRNAVWSDYEMVTHNLTFDSTGNYPNAFVPTGSPVQVDGAFGTLGGMSFDGLTQFIQYDMGGRDPWSGVNIGDVVTSQMYMLTSGTGTTRRALQIRSTAVEGVQMIQNQAGLDTFGAGIADGINNAVAINKVSADETIYNNVVAVQTFQDGGTPNPSNLVYFNDDSTGNIVSASNLIGGAVGDFITLGGRSDGGGLYDGNISEVRHRHSELDPDWVETENNNQSAAGSWGTVGDWGLAFSAAWAKGANKIVTSYNH